MPVRCDVELANLTDAGCQRDHNEDYYGYFEPECEEEFRAKGRMLAIADGMGGHAGGQVASGLAINALRDVFLSGETSDPESLLIGGFIRAQQTILAVSADHPELDGMGTTCTAAILKGRQLTFGHIGDSRLHLVRRGCISQLTHDHSLLNQLLERGEITAEEAAAHENRNVLTAALGMKSEQVSADFSPEPLELDAGDILVMTSDGLHGVVSAAEIAEIVSLQRPNEACRALVNLAKERTGPDNITIQVLRI